MIGTKNRGAIKVGKALKVPENVARVLRVLNLAKDAPVEAAPKPPQVQQPKQESRSAYKRRDMQAEQPQPAKTFEPAPPQAPASTDVGAITTKTSGREA